MTICSYIDFSLGPPLTCYVSSVKLHMFIVPLFCHCKEGRANSRLLRELCNRYTAFRKGLGHIAFSNCTSYHYYYCLQTQYSHHTFISEDVYIGAALCPYYFVYMLLIQRNYLQIFFTIIFLSKTFRSVFKSLSHLPHYDNTLRQSLMWGFFCSF